MAAAVVRQQSSLRFRSGRVRGRHGSGEEQIHLDFAKDPAENVKEILSYVIKQSSFSKAKKIGYLNAFVKLIITGNDVASLGIPLRGILICLSVNLLHAPKEVRAGSLRVIKHLVTDEGSLQILLDLHLDYFIARSLDICLDNEIERIHAQKLTRRLTSAVASKVPRSLIHPLVAVACDGVNERDRMVRASLSCLCELTYENPELASDCGAIGILLYKILDCHQYPRINESLVSAILHLVNYPSTRHYVKFDTDLEQLIAPFTDCHYSYTGEASDQSVEDRESRFAASRMAIVTVMRSWPGIVRFCRPDGSGLQSLVGILYLPFAEIRQAVVELIYELFQIALPDWTTDFTQALISIDPSKMVDDWLLTEDFVANEGKSILPNAASVRPNLVENHLALLLAAWMGAGVLDALVEVIITTKDELFIRAVILLGELLHLGNQLLPAECSHQSYYLPSLMALASSFDIPNSQRHQASVAVSYLDRIHSVKKRGPVPCSLYLDQLLRHSGMYRDRPLSLNMQKNKLLDLHIRKRASSSEEVCMQCLRDTQVLLTKDHKQWDLNLIEYVLKWPDAKLRKLEDQTHLRFIRRMVFFFKPTNHEFSRIESSNEFQQKYAIVGCQLVDFLVRCEQEEGVKIMSDFLSDIALCLSEVALQRIAPESVLSPGNVISTLAHYYFLFLGRFSMAVKGDRQVEKTGIYQYLLDIVTSAPQDSYVKLITSSLYYGKEGNCRAVLSKALSAGQESGRLYSTKLMRVLVRARVQGFSNWGIEMLVSQLYDQSRSVAMSALSVLEEACEIKENLNALVKMKPSFLHLGEKGIMILCRFMATPAGYKFLTDANYTVNELKKWHTSFNVRYVKIVEELLNEALTTYEKTYEGSYTRRSSKKRQRRDVFVPTHLYGQLVQHKDSFNLLRQQQYIEEYFDYVRSGDVKTHDEILQLKAALWAVGHISMSSWGAGWLQEEKIVPEIIRQAEESQIYSVRGTAFFVLGMVSCTREGAVLLSQYGWESRWSNRSEQWPVVEDHAALLEDSMEDCQADGDFSHFSMDGSRYELGSPVSNLDFIAEEHFQLGGGKSGGDKCVKGGEDDDSESGIHMLDIKTLSTSHTSGMETRHSTTRMKSKTLTLPASGGARTHTLPHRAQTFRSIALPDSVKDRTRSVEHISNKDFSILHEQRSQSVNLNVKHKYEADSVINNNLYSAVDKNSVKNPPAPALIQEHAGESVATAGLTVTLKTQPISGASEQPAIIGENPIETSPSSNTCQATIKPATEQIVVSKDTSVSASALSQRETSHLEVRIESFTIDSSDTDNTPATSMEQNKAHSKSSNVNQIEINVTDTDLESERCSDNQNQSSCKQDTSDNAHKHCGSEKGESSEGKHVDQGAEHVTAGSASLSEADKIDISSEKSDESNEASRRGVAKKFVIGVKEERSSSSDSSRTTKSRTDSFNTDITSGIDSFDSGLHGGAELHSLSPIASTNSVNSVEVDMVEMRHKDKPEVRDQVHHSTALRRMSNLTRVPSIRRQSSPGIGLLPASKFFDFSENAITYTTTKDAIGYATLRSLMKTRQISMEMESDYGLNNLYDNMGSTSSINRRPSMDATEMRRPKSLMFNLSGVSLNEMDSSQATPKARLYTHRPHTGQAEFMGITLPVDINMIFEVTDAEYDGNLNILGTDISRQTSIQSMSRQSSYVEGTGEMRTERSYSGLDGIRPEFDVKGSRSSTMSATDVSPAPLSSEHNKDICLLCRGISSDVHIHPIDENVEKTDGAGRLSHTAGRSRASSVNEGGLDTSSSLTSTASDSSASKKVNFDTTMGRTLVRKEMIRYVINLSSSVGVKGAEQGLLSLKQNFPMAFQDLCFYSEVCHLLGTCSFRLTARRFIQELFEDIDISRLVEEAYEILGVEETMDKAVRDKSLPEHSDGFENFT